MEYDNLDRALSLAHIYGLVDTLLIIEKVGATELA